MSYETSAYCARYAQKFYNLKETGIYTYGRWDNIYICNERLRLSVFLVKKFMVGGFPELLDAIRYRRYIGMCVPNSGGYTNTAALQAGGPVYYSGDQPQFFLNTNVLRILMDTDMAFYQGWQYLNPVDGRNLGEYTLLTGNVSDPWNNAYVMRMAYMYRRYCRFDFGEAEKFVSL